MGDRVERAGEPDVVQPVEERRERRAQFGAGEPRADAEVVAEAEGEVLGRVRPFDVELVGPLELRCVTVGRGVAHHHRSVGRDLGTGDRGRARGRAPEAGHRAVEAQALVDEVVEQAPVGPQLGHLFGVADQEPQAGGERRGRRLEPTGHELVEQILELLHRERRRVLFGAVGPLRRDDIGHAVGVGEQREQIVGRLRASRLQLPGEVVLGVELDLGLLDRLLHRHHPLGAGEHRIGPPLEPRVLRRVEPELFADHDARQWQREVGDELTLARRDEPVDQFVGDLGDPGLERVDVAPREDPGEKTPVVRVHGRVGSLQRLCPLPSPFGKHLAGGAGRRRHAPVAPRRAVREVPGIGEHALSVLVARQHEEPVLRQLVHRAVLAHRGVSIERVILRGRVEEARDRCGRSIAGHDRSPSGAAATTVSAGGGGTEGSRLHSTSKSRAMSSTW